MRDSIADKLKKMKRGNQILDYFKEITIVVIGVLIAVSVGNYKERLDNGKYLRKTLTAIEKEVTTSQSDIDTVLSRHIGLYKKLENEFGQNEQTLGAFISSSGGFQVAPIKNISLRFFISNKATVARMRTIGNKILNKARKSPVLPSSSKIKIKTPIAARITR